MVAKTEFNGQVYYLHCAFSDDEDGTNFSLTEYDDALMRGTYRDQSETESTDPARYNWSYNATDEPIEEADDDISEQLLELEEIADQLSADSLTSDMDLSSSQHNTDTEIGNVNLLIGTNKGLNGWSAPSSLTLSETSESIYTDLDTTNYLTISCNTSGNVWAAFSSENLRKVLAQETEGSSYTLSLDIRQSSIFSIPVSVRDEDGSNVQITFDAIDNTSDDSDKDNTDAWVHVSSTALSLGISESMQSLYFDLTQMPEGSTVDIANLKVEEGALATPWRESLEEINAKAEAAKEAADNAKDAAEELDGSVSTLQEDVYGDSGITETITGLVGETKAVTDEKGEAVYDEITYTDSDGTEHTEKVARTERIPGRLDELDQKMQDAAGKAQQALDNQAELPAIKTSAEEAKELLKEWSLDDGSGNIDGSKIAKGTITSEKIAAGALLISNFSQEALSLIHEPLKYIRSATVDGELVIEIGEEGSPYKVTISKKGMHLYANGTAAAYFTTDTMKITKARILQSIRFGAESDGKDDFAFVPQPNGNLSFKLLEDTEE
nr:MAG TPA_asm: Minor structural protein 4 [Caudoviricetes sp.]